ncbi:hypothetical protein LMJF_31_0795 [Leishmania major strain Friedlin]|uniref:Uncharacterized protein n=1 Tax=Leishmania major TaxID=5664 RepID=E9AEF2_LEIMA|nr:hypothetical protein LMJF_31_0795 [Leishmania major strain Friedlin]CBZ05861.1 hypothetical protein LMJF_31_0795 [Leishmania major strain Friedlin]|eukprot:XP_003722373.1 hypothetical protein LMJF_31_0795 [Leishmania major strain Friedlin]
MYLWGDEGVAASLTGHSSVMMECCFAFFFVRFFSLLPSELFFLPRALESVVFQ